MRSAPQDPPASFAHDPVEDLREPAWIGGEELHEATLVASEGGATFLGLEHRVGEPTGLVRIAADGKSETLDTGGARLANPQLTPRGDPSPPAVSYESESEDGRWQVTFDGLLLDAGQGHALSHRTATGPEGESWIVWQQDRGGQWDIVACEVSAAGEREPLVLVSDSPRGDWAPDVVVTPRGDICIAWDRFDGTSFDVVARWRIGGRWQAPVVVAGGPAFQGRPRLAASPDGEVWCVYERGADRWGAPFRGKDKDWNNVTDDYGPLHRFRSTEVAVLAPDGGVSEVQPRLPQPAFVRQAKRTDKRDGVERLGVYYERPAIAFDAAGRPWVAYRHYVGIQLVTEDPTLHHRETGWRIQLRSLDSDRWSEPVAFAPHQRDGYQRLELRPVGDGVGLAWTAGRSDRRLSQAIRGQRGVAWATLDAAPPAGDSRSPGARLSARKAQPAQQVEARSAPRRPEFTGEESFELLLGDLHRHTDMSLCFPYYDGSLDDAYRYATEVAQLDFLAVTDHARDIDQGDHLSQLWSRITRAVDRHHLPAGLVTLHAFERSHGDTDHNVITLKPEVLRPHNSPLADYWAELDTDTLTIPHNPIQPKTWEIESEQLRPLIEIYQGFRDESSTSQAHRGLLHGQRFGFIGSSDHLSTSASYAGVWTTDRSREGIVRALQARRTFAATEPMRLVFRFEEHWMGDRIRVSDAPRLYWSVEGNFPVATIQLVVNGEVAYNARRAEGLYALDLPAGEESSVYLVAALTNGARAWSSPLFISL